METELRSEGLLSRIVWYSISVHFTIAAGNWIRSLGKVYQKQVNRRLRFSGVIERKEP